MSRINLLKALVVALSLGLFTYVLTKSDEQVSHAQTGFDRTQLANDRPVGDLQAQDDLPQTGEFNVMIELKDLPSAKVYAQTLGNKSDKAANPQERGAAQSAARSQTAKIKGAQQRVLAHLGNFGRNAKVLYSVQAAYNGIAAAVGLQKIVTVTGSTFQDPEVPPENVQVIVGPEPLPIETAMALTPGHFEIVDANHIRFRFPIGSLNSGDVLPLRIVVNGAENAQRWVRVP